MIDFFHRTLWPFSPTLYSCCRNKYYCGIAQTRTVLFSPFLACEATQWSNDTKLTALDPCQFHKLLFVAQGSVMQNREGSPRLTRVCVCVCVCWMRVRKAERATRIQIHCWQMCACLAALSVGISHKEAHHNTVQENGAGNMFYSCCLNVGQTTKAFRLCLV